MNVKPSGCLNRSAVKARLDAASLLMSPPFILCRCKRAWKPRLNPRLTNRAEHRAEESRTKEPAEEPGRIHQEEETTCVLYKERKS